MKQSNLFSLQELHRNKWKLVGKMTVRNERPNCALYSFNYHYMEKKIEIKRELAFCPQKMRILLGL